MPSGITTPREPVLSTLMAGTDPEGKNGAFCVFPTSKKHDFRLETPLPQQYTLAPSTTHSKSPAPDGSPARSLKPASGQSSASRQKSPQTRNQPVIEKQLFTSLDGSLSKNPYPVIAVDHHHCIGEDDPGWESGKEPGTTPNALRGLPPASEHLPFA